MSSNTYTVTTRAVSGGKRTSGTGASASAGGIAPTTSGVTEHSELSGRGQQDQHPMSAVTGLSEFKAVFDSMFEKVNLGTDAAPDYAIKAKLDFYSIGGITAYSETTGGGTGGVSNLYQLDDVPDYRALSNKVLKVKSDHTLEWSDAADSAAEWGNITGLITAQADLANALASKQGTISDLATIRANASSGLTAYGWGNHASQGYLTAITKSMVENVLTGNISSHAHTLVPNAKHINPTYLPTLSGNTVLDYKNALASVFSNIGVGIGDNVTVPYEVVRYWEDDTHVVSPNDLYSVIKIGGAYGGVTYGQWLLSSYEDQDLYLLGKGYNGWGQKKKIYHSHNLTTLSQLTDNLGSNPLHTHSQYLTSVLAATSYHPKGGSTALALSASSLTLAGAIGGATDIAASGTLRVSGGVTLGSSLTVSDIITTKRISLSNNGHTLVIELDSDGNLKINGNVLATGGVAAYQTA